MTQKNYLLGRGERLTEDVLVRRSGGPKQAPYTFAESKRRLAPMLTDAVKQLESLPWDACPRDQAVLSLTLNPEYLAKSFFPGELMRTVGVEVVGSRPVRITPQKRSRGREPVETTTTELFARGSRAAFRNWSEQLPEWTDSDPARNQIISIERVHTPIPATKVKGSIPNSGEVQLELVLHADELEGEFDIVAELRQFMDNRGIHAEFGRRFYAQGLCFVELSSLSERVKELTQFSALRALRKMPVIRVLRPTIRSSGIPSKVPSLPAEPPLSNETSMAIFDGGIPDDHPLTMWVTPYDVGDLQPPTDDLLEHGVAVTSAALFGHIDPKQELERPYSYIDHYRVLDEAPGQDVRELFDVLERIDSVLSQKTYDFVNLSIGPCLPIEDDEIHAWTAVIDDRMSRAKTLATVAVGNDGESDEATGLNRVQVPSDCVNAIAVGACDSLGPEWQRAPYSSVGPGRSPGRVKPDIVGFGGSLTSPYVVLSSDSTPRLTSTGGTSFAAPSVLRIANGVRSQFGKSLSPLAIRALLIHAAEAGDQGSNEIGWGRCAATLDAISLCGDDEVRVVYQGEISPTKYIRAPIPFPDERVSGMIFMKATICYNTLVDPHHPGNYTRAGLDIAFRPHDEKFSRSAQVHPDTKSFFGRADAGATESELRRDAWKWENCLHANKRFRADSLSNPAFDIHYNARLEGRDHKPPSALSYALVVTVKAKAVVNLYDQVVRKYAARLTPLRPVVDVPVRARP